MLTTIKESQRGITMLAFLLISSLLLQVVTSETRDIEYCTESSISRYYKEGGVCLQAYPTSETYTDVLDTCQQANGYPIMIKDKQKEEAVHEFLVGITGDGASYWNGLADVAATGTFVFADGSPLGSYQPWEIPPEENNSGHTCVVQKYDDVAEEYLWETVDCAVHSSAYICELPPLVKTVSCDPGWSMNDAGDACIKVVKKYKRTFDGAKQFCSQRLGAKLATKITSKAERRHARGLVGNWRHYWIGVQSLNYNGVFTDFEGNTLADSGFLKDYSSRTNHHCASFKKGGWIPKKCGNAFPFICQKEPTEDPGP